jgi:hypothetical protein
MAASLKITDRFHFSGFLKGKMSIRCSILVTYIMPSVSEPFGISPLKHSIEFPVIISKQSGVSKYDPCD